MLVVDTNVLVRFLTADNPKQAQRALAVIRDTNVRVEDPEAVQQALSWFTAGLDFADALHLASSGGSEAFVTCGANFRKRRTRRQE